MELLAAARTLRQRAEEMPPTQAVDYLLMCLEDLADAYTGGHHPVDDMIADLTPMERRLAVLMHDRAGRVVTRQSMASAQALGGETAPSEHSISAMIHKLRRKLPHGVGIETVRGLGYRMTLLHEEPWRPNDGSRPDHEMVEVQWFTGPAGIATHTIRPDQMEWNLADERYIVCWRPAH